MSIIDISDFTLAERCVLLSNMWHGTTPKSFFLVSGLHSPKLDLVSLENAVQGGYIGYFQGKDINADLSKSTISTTLYEVGSLMGAPYGSIQKFVDQIRSDRIVIPIETPFIGPMNEKHIYEKRFAKRRRLSWFDSLFGKLWNKKLFI